MSKHDANTLLSDMVHYAGLAIELASDLSREEFLASEEKQLAITRAIEIVGEAARRLDGGLRTRLPGVPWEDIIGMRDALAHGYDVLELGRIWDTVKEDLPPLVEQLRDKLTRDSEMNH